MSNSDAVVDEQERRINDEIEQLLKDIRRIGPTYPPPNAQVLFGELFDDEEAQQYYEALVGTLKSAKKRGVVRFKGQMLLKGMHDKVVISIVGEAGDNEPVEVEPKAVYRPSMVKKSKAILPKPPKITTVPKTAPKRVFSYMKKKKPQPPPQLPPPPQSPKSPIKETPKSEIDGHMSDSEARQKEETSASLKVNVASDSEDYVLKSPRRLSVPTAFRSSNLLPPNMPRRKTMRKPLLLKRWSDQDMKKKVVEQPKKEKSSRVPPQRAVSMPSAPRNSAKEAASRVEDEVMRLLEDIKRVGSNPGEPSVKFGELFDDDEVQNTYEALVGTLRSAKRQGLISFKGQMLLKGMHDNVVIHVVESK